MPQTTTTKDPFALNITVGGKHYASFHDLAPLQQRAMLAFFSFRDPVNKRKYLPFSFSDLCARCAIDKNSRAADEVLAFLKDLLRGTMTDKDPVSGVSKELPLFEDSLTIERGTR